jgi:hypothetical protein
MTFQSFPFNGPTGSVPFKASALGCENGRHSALGSSKSEINGVVHAICRHCGCELMRLGASRRWFRTGQMGG